MKLKLVAITVATFSATLLVVFSGLAVVSASRAHAAGDDVFMDDGEGDFDSVPVPSSAPKNDKSASTHQADAPPAAPSALGDEAQAVMGGEPAPAAPPIAHTATPDEAAPVVEDTAPVAPTAPAPTKHKAAKASHQAVHKAAEPTVAKTEKASAGGKFLMTKDSCDMHREPASESEKMITVKASRKIWTEKVDENWVKAYNKAGEPGFISKDCF